MEGFLREQQAVEHVEYYDEYRDLGVINQKVCHCTMDYLQFCYLLLSIWSMSSFSSSTLIFSSLTNEETALR